MLFRSQYDSETQTTTVNTIEIDQTAYDALVESSQIYSLPTGLVTVSTTKKIVSVYDYEVDLNESKRTIKLIKPEFVNILEEELRSVLS